MRLFIAIDISDALKDELVRLQDALKKSEAEIKWPKKDNMHLTIKFLGEAGDEKIKEIVSIMDRISSAESKFEFSICNLGAFPKLDFPKVVWVDIDNNCSTLEKMADRIDNECSGIGFQKEARPFRAHLTLGRVRSPKNKAKLKELIIATDVKPVKCLVEKIVLYKSTLTPEGPIYAAVYSSNLK